MTISSSLSSLLLQDASGCFGMLRDASEWLCYSMGDALTIQSCHFQIGWSPRAPDPSRSQPIPADPSRSQPIPPTGDASWGDSWKRMRCWRDAGAGPGSSMPLRPGEVFIFGGGVRWGDEGNGRGRREMGYGEGRAGWPWILLLLLLLLLLSSRRLRP